MFKRVILEVSLLLLVFSNVPNMGFAQEARQRVVMIIAGDNFRDEELLVPKDMLETNNIAVVLASTTVSPVRGMLGTVVKPNLLLEDITVADYEALIFVGGSGAREYWDNETAHRLARQARDAGKIISAICLAPVTLARAGILAAKKATVWPGAAAELKACGATYTGENVEIDGNIITADGPQSADKFGEALVIALVRRR